MLFKTQTSTDKKYYFYFSSLSLRICTGFFSFRAFLLTCLTFFTEWHEKRVHFRPRSALSCQESIINSCQSSIHLFSQEKCHCKRVSDFKKKKSAHGMGLVRCHSEKSPRCLVVNDKSQKSLLVTGFACHEFFFTFLRCLCLTESGICSTFGKGIAIKTFFSEIIGQNFRFCCLSLWTLRSDINE